jgi:hypothetical protein
MSSFTSFNGGCLDQTAFYLRMRNGLERIGHRQSPLEAMAYEAETAFDSSAAVFNAEKMVTEKLGF